MLTIEQRVANALVAYVGYIGKMLWPTDLAVFYPYERLSLTSWQVVFAGIVLVFISVGAYWSAKRSPAVGVGWLWYLGTLVPVVGLVQVGSQGMADRYTYVPLIGLFLLITWGLTDMAVRIGLSTRALAAGGVCVLAFLTASISAQLPCWRNSIALFQRALEATRGNYIAHTNLGTALMEQGGTDEAIAHYREALAINASYEETHNALALALTAKGDLDGAIEQLQEVVEINPDSPIARNKLGIMLSQKGQLAEAILHFEQGIASNPRDPPLRENLGITLEKQGDLAGARATYERALRLVADDGKRARIHNRIGNVFLREGNIASAVEQYREALRLAPGYEKARVNLDLALRQLKS